MLFERSSLLSFCNMAIDGGNVFKLKFHDQYKFQSSYWLEHHNDLNSIIIGWSQYLLTNYHLNKELLNASASKLMAKYSVSSPKAPAQANLFPFLLISHPVIIQQMEMICLDVKLKVHIIGLVSCLTVITALTWDSSW